MRNDQIPGAPICVVSPQPAGGQDDGWQSPAMELSPDEGRHPVPFCRKTTPLVTEARPPLEKSPAPKRGP